MKHSRSWFNQIRTFAQAQGGRILILTGSGPGFYAGLGAVPKKTLLESCLHFLAVPEYQAIDIFTGLSDSNSDHLPEWQISGATVGRSFIGWQFRTPQPVAMESKGSVKLEEISDDDFFADHTWKAQEHTYAEQTFELLPQFPREPLNDRYRQMLAYALGRLGYHWNGSRLQQREINQPGKHLIIIDESFFKPTSADLTFFRQPAQTGEVSQNQGLESQFNALPELIKGSPVDLVILAANPFFKENLVSGQWFLDLLLPALIPYFGDADRAKASIRERIPRYQWPAEIESIHIEALDPEIPYGNIFSSQKQTVKDWFTLLQTTPFQPLKRNAWDELEAMTGLQAVKDSIRQMENRIRLEQKRSAAKEKYQAKSISGHFVFYGNPGTGKTTVAHLLGRILKELGVLPSNKVIKAERPQLVAGYVGQTAIKTNELIDQAMGGILFIDEAYTLAQGGENDFGKEAINTLLTRMENDRGHFVVVAAGYRNPMQSFIEANEGLRSRFNSFLEFEDYTSEELYEIFLYMVNQGQNFISSAPETEIQLKQFFEKMYSQRGEKFGNAREVRNFYDQVCSAQATRLAALSQPSQGDELFTITGEDIKAVTGD